jgi:hypothetical protein
MTGYRGSLSRLKDQPGQHWTVILNPEKRKVGGSTPPLTTRIATMLTWTNAVWRPCELLRAFDPHGPFVTIVRRTMSHADRTASCVGDGR